MGRTTQIKTCAISHPTDPTHHTDQTYWNSRHRKDSSARRRGKERVDGDSLDDRAKMPVECVGHRQTREAAFPGELVAHLNVRENEVASRQATDWGSSDRDDRKDL
jgi:hypothetical protein